MISQVLLVMGLLAFKGPSDLRLIKSLRVMNGAITTDQLGQLYVLNQDQSIEKYNRDGKLLISNSFRGFGPLASLDASNPMELYAFYREQNVLLLLDNQLGVRGQLDLNRTGSNAISCLARSYDNGIWLFDQQDLQLKKYSKQIELQLQSGNIRSLTGRTISPVYMEEDGKQIIMLDTAYGVVVFDIYANYKFSMPGKWKSVQSFGSEWYLFEGDSLERLDFNAIFGKKMALPALSSKRSLRVQKNRLYIQSADSLCIYAY